MSDGTGSEPFHVAFSTAGSWSKAAKDCRDQLPEVIDGPQGAYLGFVYATDLFDNNLSSILTFLRETTGVSHWVGTVGLGVFASGLANGGGRKPENEEPSKSSQKFDVRFDQPALSVMLARFEPDSFKVFPTLGRNLDDFKEANGQWLARAQPGVALVHGDPRNQLTTDILHQFSIEAAPFLIGGLTSSRGLYEQIADYPMEGGLSGVLLSSEIPVISAITQSCLPIGDIHRITECRDGHVISQIDGRSAFDVFAEELGESLSAGKSKDENESPESKKVSVVAALPVAGSDTGDYLVRNLAGVDPDQGTLVISEKMATGDPIMFCRRSRDFAENDMKCMLKSIKKRLPAPPRGGIYITCVGRGADFFGSEAFELESIREELGDFPLVGFSANGEISSDRLYGYTGVLSLFL